MLKKSLAALLTVVVAVTTITQSAISKADAVVLTKSECDVGEWNDFEDFDMNNDDALSVSEAKKVKEIRWLYQKTANKLKFFPNLEELDTGLSNDDVKKIDVSKNKKLKRLSINSSKLTKLDISKNKKLEYLLCCNNKLTKLDVSKNTSLKELSCFNDKLKTLKLGNNKKLETLDCSANKLTQLDVTKCTKLKELRCYNNKLKTLDVRKNKKLSILDCDNTVKVKR